MSRRTTICREGWYYLLVLAFVVCGALLREINLLIVMAGMMLVPFLLGWRLVVIGLRPLKVTRRAPATIAAGDLLVVDITAASPPVPRRRLAMGAWAVNVEDSLRSEQGPDRRRPLSTCVFFWRIPRGDSQRISYRGRLLRRGRYRFGPLRVSSRFPLGLVRRTVVFDAPQDLLVLPRLGRLMPAWVRFYRQALSGSGGGQQVRQTVLEGNFHGLRDWRPGDARRQIHWRTSARRRTPIVRLFEQQHSRELVLILDLSVLRGAKSRDEESLERAVSFTATVVHDICRRGGSQLTLILAGTKTVTLRGPASAGLLHECLAQLAVAEPGGGTSLERVVEGALAELRSSAALVVVSAGVLDLATSEKWDGLASNGRSGGVRRVMTVNAASDELAEYFSWDEEPSPASCAT